MLLDWGHLNFIHLYATVTSMNLELILWVIFCGETFAV